MRRAVSSPAGVSVLAVTPGPPTALLLTPLPYDRRIWGSFAALLGSRMGLAIATWPGVEDRRLLPYRQIHVGAGLLDVALGSDIVIAFGNDCSVAVSLAADPRVRALILVDPLALDLLDGLGESNEDSWESSLTNLPDGLIEAFMNKDAETMGRLGVGGYAPWLTPSDLELTRKVLTENAEVVWGRLSKVHYDPDWVGRFERVSKPMLVVTSSRAIPSRMATRLASLNAVARVASLDTETDLPWLEDGPGLARIIGDFAEEVLRAGSA